MPNIAIGAIVNSALYLFSVFFAAIWFHAYVALDLAVTAMGLAYLSYIAQLTPSFLRASPAAVTSARIIVGFSILVGFLAGVAVLVRI